MTRRELQELLEDAHRCARLSNWEQDFVADLSQRYAGHGDDPVLSDKQLAVINRIEEKVYACG